MSADATQDRGAIEDVWNECRGDSGRWHTLTNHERYLLAKLYERIYPALPALPRSKYQVGPMEKR